jgi:hypothetical protein
MFLPKSAQNLECHFIDSCYISQITKYRKQKDSHCRVARNACDRPEIFVWFPSPSCDKVQPLQEIPTECLVLSMDGRISPE